MLTESKRDCFQDGVDARAKGQALADNPHCIRTDDYAEWAAGWRATFDLDEDDDPTSLRMRDIEPDLSR